MSATRDRCKSRVPLSVDGEVVWPLAGLGVPQASDDLPVEELATSEAVALFVSRARAADPDFVRSWHNAAAIVDLCCRLDGLPLALELAAARVRGIDLSQFASLLDDRSFMLNRLSRSGSVRHQTLRNTIEWSYNLLTLAERVLLDRLSVFAGGWDTEAAKAVCGDDILPANVVEVLARLVDQSLVQVERGPVHGQRFRLLETIRAYATTRLRTSGDSEIHRRHAEHYARLAEAVGPRLFHALSDQPGRSILDVEYENLRVALSWCLSDPASAHNAARLGAALWPFWLVRQRTSEGRQWLE
jgi:predicted ATPase